MFLFNWLVIIWRNGKGGRGGVQSFFAIGRLRSRGRKNLHHVHHCPFWKIEIKCPDFGKGYPLCVHLLVKFSFKNAVLRVSWRKKHQNFSLLFCMSYMTRFWKCPYFKKPSLSQKVPGCLLDVDDEMIEKYAAFIQFIW